MNNNVVRFKSLSIHIARWFGLNEHHHEYASNVNSNLCCLSISRSDHLTKLEHNYVICDCNKVKFQPCQYVNMDLTKNNFLVLHT